MHTSLEPVSYSLMCVCFNSYPTDKTAPKLQVFSSLLQISVIFSSISWSLAWSPPEIITTLPYNYEIEEQSYWVIWTSMDLFNQCQTEKERKWMIEGWGERNANKQLGLLDFPNAAKLKRIEHLLCWNYDYGTDCLGILHLLSQGLF